MNVSGWLGPTKCSDETGKVSKVYTFACRAAQPASGHILVNWNTNLQHAM